MSDDGILNREFIAHLQSEYQHARKHRADHLLAVAGQDTFDAETRRRYLDAALAFDPHAMAAVLHDIMARETSASVDRISAATLYLHGGNEAWWDVPTPAAERARKLLAPKKDQPMKPSKERKARAITAAADTDRGLYIAISQACIRMEASLKGSAVTDDAKLEAIARFFRIVGCIAPDQLDASITKAAEKLKLNPQPRSM